MELMITCLHGVIEELSPTQLHYESYLKINNRDIYILSVIHCAHPILMSIQGLELTTFKNILLPSSTLKEKALFKQSLRSCVF